MFSGVISALFLVHASVSGAFQPEFSSETASVAPQVLTLMFADDPDEPAKAQDESGLDEFLFSGHWIRFQFGGNFAFDSDIKNQSASPVGIRNGSISFDPGFDLLFTWGIPVWEALSLEISTGFSYNSVKSVDGSWAPGQVPVTGGNGNVNGVPLVIGLGYAFDVAESISLSVNAAVGAQFSYADISGVGAPGVAGSASVNANAISFRYQVGAQADWKLCSDVGLGVYVRYSGTTQANFGALGFTAPGVSPGPDLIFTDLSALAVGLNFFIDF